MPSKSVSLDNTNATFFGDVQMFQSVVVWPDDSFLLWKAYIPGQLLTAKWKFRFPKAVKFYHLSLSGIPGTVEITYQPFASNFLVLQFLITVKLFLIIDELFLEVAWYTKSVDDEILLQQSNPIFFRVCFWNKQSGVIYWICSWQNRAQSSQVCISKFPFVFISKNIVQNLSRAIDHLFRPSLGLISRT